LSHADTRLQQALLPETQDALSADWAAFVKTRRVERDRAVTQLGKARAAAPTPKADLINLLDAWPTLSTQVKRQIIAGTWPVIAVQKEKDADGNLVTRFYGSIPDGLRGRGNWSSAAGRPAFHPL
jgi:hypothetical protein